VPERAWGFESPLSHACDVSGHRGRMCHDIVDTLAGYLGLPVGW
jgi:hypothetical protein